ncbi:hypothetical protein CYMTET_49090 [Cymbomonas tetramitiformis]|uniref:Response regulatory domain-containing protein n=1 Tax=Cymbomonas tetramitiformis TaxID=36881 RepID=A0AAE0EW44_9CHLO|nr:hypothetical protein CYMTET_49090 [Cymbomonas tetramitiformis]
MSKNSSAEFRALETALPPPNYTDSFKAPTDLIAGAARQNNDRGYLASNSGRPASGSNRGAGGTKGALLSRAMEDGCPTTYTRHGYNATRVFNPIGQELADNHRGHSQLDRSVRAPPIFRRLGQAHLDASRMPRLRGMAAEEEAEEAEEAEAVSALLGPAPAAPATTFRKAFERGELPVTVSHQGATNGIKWKTPLDTYTFADFNRLLPFFLEGLCETSEKHRFVAIRGSLDLVKAVGENGLAEQIAPSLVRTVQGALAGPDVQVAGEALNVLNRLLDYQGVASALLLGMRPLLMACLRLSKKNTIITVGANRNKKVELRDLVQTFLEKSEERGGTKAFKIIKGCIPEYISCIKKPIALLVEGDRIDQKEGTTILKQLGYEVMVTASIAEAEGAIAMEGRNIDFLLADTGPRADPVGLVDMLLQSRQKKVATVAVSATPSAGQRDYYLEGGFQAYLRKPLDISRVRVALEQQAS